MFNSKLVNYQRVFQMGAWFESHYPLWRGAGSDRTQVVEFKLRHVPWGYPGDLVWLSWLKRLMVIYIVDYSCITPFIILWYSLAAIDGLFPQKSSQQYPNRFIRAHRITPAHAVKWPLRPPLTKLTSSRRLQQGSAKELRIIEGFE